MDQHIQKNSIAIMGLALLSVVMLTAGVISRQGPAYDPFDLLNQPSIFEHRVLKASTSNALDVAFETAQYGSSLSSEKTVPPLILDRLPEDLASVRKPGKRQELFVRALLPIVLIENRRIREQRELAKLLLEGEQPVEGSPMHTWLKNLAYRLRVRGDLKNPKVISRILNRLDVIPPDLALAQAAIETGWGTSRFALEGNSLFGQWTFKSDNGLMPSDRNSDDNHFVASFPDLRSSVRAYMRNLNTGNAYKEFRIARSKLRTDGKQIDALKLADYLYRYSERGELYTAELKKLIKNRYIASLAKASLGTLRSKLVVASLD
jgi:Bax protein